MKKYQKYKDSGIVWIGEIPSHWNIIKIKRLSQVKRGASPRPIDDLKYFDENGEFSWVRISDLTASERYLMTTEEKLSELGASLSVKRYPGDFFLSIAGSVGKPIISKIKCCIHDGFVWFPDLKINPEYLYYLFQSGLPFGGLGKLGTQLNLNTETIGNIYIPDLTDQDIEKIVQYLDHQTAIIDQVIQQKEKLIELLKEKRQAVINEAVTKGLNPNAKMKDSGIKWLGEVPEHWKVLNFRYVIDVLTDFTANGSFADLAKNVTYLETGYSRLIRLTDLRENLNNTGLYVSENSHNYLSKSSLYGDEVLLANVGAYAGLAWKVPQLSIPSTLGPNMFLLKFNKSLNNDFGYYSLISSYLSDQLKNKAVSAAQPKLNKEDVRSCLLVQPPIAEQTEIVFYLAEINEKYEKLISLEETQIEKIKEYRQSIISEAVTGKIDLRDWQSNKKQVA